MVSSPCFPTPGAEGYQQVPVRTRYLEMTSPPSRPIPDLPEGLACVRWQTPSVEEYLSLYQTIGAPWGWTSRLLIDKATLASRLSSEHLDVFRLLEMPEGRTVGLFEIDLTNPRVREIVLLGLTPDSLGKGYGASLMDAAIRQSWGDSTQRVWLRTSEHDHSRALEAYQRAGFVVYDERIDLKYRSQAFLRARIRSGEQ